ncbi:hypothetical protein I4F81_008439 [Pyropia yezoensis]|uniref:Uncharacterized protein n=1 Tax=Pyropia yezoensis TaxID=2788 RepID=A0ACC3C7Z1_PYRYE|nr:hypothetical protein I4F81_008439 [Neopyropia yezoensis]
MAQRASQRQPRPSASRLPPLSPLPPPLPPPPLPFVGPSPQPATAARPVKVAHVHRWRQQQAMTRPPPRDASRSAATTAMSAASPHTCLPRPTTGRRGGATEAAWRWGTGLKTASVPAQATSAGVVVTARAAEAGASAATSGGVRPKSTSPRSARRRWSVATPPDTPRSALKRGDA